MSGGGELRHHTPGDPGLVVVGGGVAGLRVVQTVRQEGYTGPVTLLGAEPWLPYDRPPLSKQVLTGDLALDATGYHPASYFSDEIGVDTVLGVTATGIDVARHRLLLADGDALPYRALVVATGSRPRRLPFVSPSDGVHVLRTREDAARLRQDLARAGRLAIVGAGFVGAEVASSAASLGVEVTVVETAPTPLVRAVGAVVGAELARLHTDAGVRLVCGKAVTGFVGRDRVEGLTLDDGSVLEVDLVLVGVGVVPDVEWLQDSGLALDDGLACDDHLATGADAVYGAGDAVSWPSVRLGRRARSQQWTTASDQGRHVGRVLVRGREEAGPFDHDLYFWSDEYGSRIQGFGATAGEAVVLSRDPAKGSFLAGFRAGDVLTGAVGVNAPREFAAVRKRARTDDSWQAATQHLPPLHVPLPAGADR